jgi:hypothetical protein
MPIGTPDWSALVSENERLADGLMARSATTTMATALPVPAPGTSSGSTGAGHQEDQPEFRRAPQAGHRRRGRLPHRRG